MVTPKKIEASPLQGKSPAPLWLFMALPLLASAISHDFWAPDEPRYGEVAREVFAGEGGIAMYLNGSLYPDKPPLLFWLAGLLGWLTGWSEFAMRMVSILATLVTAHLVCLLACRWWRPREGAWAPAFFLGTVMVTEIGGRLQIDPLLTMLTTIAIVLMDGEGTKRNIRLAGLAVGFGVLAKGPIAILIPVLVALAWHFTPGARTLDQKRSLRSVLLDPVAICLAFLPATLWASAAISAEPDLMGPLLFGQHLGRLGSSGGGSHWGPPWQHLWSLPLLVLPFALPFFASLRSGLRASEFLKSDREKGVDLGLARAFAWFAVLFLFFSIIPPKRNLYLLPAYPAIALLCARWWSTTLASTFASRREQSFGRIARISAPCFLLFLGTVLTCVGFVVTFADLPVDLVARIAEMPGLRESAYWRIGVGGGVMITGGIVGFRALWTKPGIESEERGIHWEVERTRALRRGQSGAGLATLASWSLGTSLIFLMVMPMGDEVKSARTVAGQIAELHSQLPARSIPCMGIKPEGFRFYSNVPTVVVSDFAEGPLPAYLEEMGSAGEADFAWLDFWREREGAHFLAVVAESHWSRLTEEQRLGFRVCFIGRLGSKELLVIGSKLEP